MSKKEPGITTFHFKMDNLMMDELTDFVLFQETQNLSETISRILMQLFTIIEKEDMDGMQRFSKYKLINEDKSRFINLLLDFFEGIRNACQLGLEFLKLVLPSLFFEDFMDEIYCRIGAGLESLDLGFE